MQLSKAAVLIFFCASLRFAPTWGKCRDDSVCVQTKIHGMVSADCYNRDFKSFPRCLRSDVEIIDLSYNRLRKVTKEDLSRYSSLKMLYLSDNLLTKLENSTFEDMGRLRSLDLSINGIVHLPPVVFHLPSLKRLYLSQNQNINVAETVETAGPITSPLETLDISYNELETLPKLGAMPHLVLYNISGNKLENMEVSDVVGLCNLKTLANDNFTANFDEACDCWNIQKWLRDKNVRFTPFPCYVKQQGCSYSVSIEDLQLYEQCKSKHDELKMQSVLVKVGIGIGVVLALVLLVLAYCLYKKRKQRRARVRDARLNNQIVKNGKLESEGLL